MIESMDCLSTLLRCNRSYSPFVSLPGQRPFLDAVLDLSVSGFAGVLKQPKCNRLPNRYFFVCCRFRNLSHPIRPAVHIDELDAGGLKARCTAQSFGAVMNSLPASNLTTV